MAQGEDASVPTDEAPSDHEATLLSALDRIEQLTTERNAAQASLESAQAAFNRAQQQLREVTQQRDDAEAAREAAQDNVASLQLQIERMMASPEAACPTDPNTETLTAQLDTCERDGSFLRQQIRRLNDDLRQCRATAEDAAAGSGPDADPESPSCAEAEALQADIETAMATLEDRNRRIEGLIAEIGALEIEVAEGEGEIERLSGLVDAEVAPVQSAPIDCDAVAASAGMSFFPVQAGTYAVEDDTDPLWTFASAGGVTRVVIDDAFCIAASEIDLRTFQSFYDAASTDLQTRIGDDWYAQLVFASGQEAETPFQRVPWPVIPELLDWLGADRNLSFHVPSRNQWMAALIAAQHEADTGTGLAADIAAGMRRGGTREWTTTACENGGQIAMGLREDEEIRNTRQIRLCAATNNPTPRIGVRPIVMPGG